MLEMGSGDKKQRQAEKWTDAMASKNQHSIMLNVYPEVCAVC